MKRIMTVGLMLFIVTTLPARIGATEAPLSADELMRLFEGLEEAKRAYVEKSHRRSPDGAGEDARPKVQDKGHTAEKLIKRLKKDPYSYGYDKTGQTLTQRGVSVLPLLLKELDGATDYYRLSLINILSGIDAPERDAAFLKQLEKILREDRDFLADDTASTLMRTLARRKVSEAVPVMNQYLDAEGLEKEFRIEARIALGRLGKLDMSSTPRPNYEIAPELSVDPEQQLVQLLDVLLQYELFRTPLKLTEIESAENQTTVFRGTIDEGTWYVRFGEAQSGRVPFYYTWHTGPLASAGYIGVLEKVDNQWLVIFWQMIWIS